MFFKELNSFFFGVPLVAFGGADKRTCPVSAPLAYIPVHLYMGFIVDVIAYQVKYVIDDHVSAFPPCIKSAMRYFTGTLSFTAFHPSRPKLFRGFPSER